MFGQKSKRPSQSSRARNARPTAEPKASTRRPRSVLRLCEQRRAVAGQRAPTNEAKRGYPPAGPALLAPRTTHPVSHLTRIATAALREIARALSAAWDLDTTLDLFARKTTGVLCVDSCSVYLLDPDARGDRGGRPLMRLRASAVLARAAVGRVTLRLGEGLTGEAARPGRPVAPRSAQSDPRFQLIPKTHEKSFRSLVAVLLLSQECNICELYVPTRRYHDLTSNEIELLWRDGHLAAGALEKATLHDSMQRQLAELTALARVSRAVSRPIFVEKMLDVVNEMAAKMMNASVCSIFLVDEAGQNPILRSARRAGRAYRLRSSLTVGQGILGASRRMAGTSPRSTCVPIRAASIPAWRGTRVWSRYSWCRVAFAIA